MHKQVYQEFKSIFQDLNIDGKVLEVGAVPQDYALLALENFDDVEEKVGINLKGGQHNDFDIIEGNGNSMPFDDDTFDCVVCNATLEHDKHFWKTISEVKRVAAENCVIVIGVPGYTQRNEYGVDFVDKVGNSIKTTTRKVGSEIFNLEDSKNNSGNKNQGQYDESQSESTLYNISKYAYDNIIMRLPSDRYTSTFVIHEAPGDYYRFSKQTVGDVFLSDTENKEIVEIMNPPRIIGKGIYK